MLQSSSHIERCQALGHLAKNTIIAKQYIPALLAALKDPYDVVVTSALTVFQSLGVQAYSAMPTIIIAAAQCTQEKGCTYDCCGFQAYKKPMEQYITYLQAIGNSKEHTTILENIALLQKDGSIDIGEAEELCMLLNEM